MQNIKSIQPLQTYTTDGIKTINAIVFTAYSGYDFINEGGNVAFALVHMLDDVSYVSLINDSCDIPYNIFNEWTTDDSVLYNYVINAKGLTAI